MPGENYNSAYTGPEIDSAVGSVQQNASTWSGKQAPLKAQTVTLTTSGWVTSGERVRQTVSVEGITTATPIIWVDVALTGTDIDADNEALNAWAGPAACNVDQGNGSLTFYSAEAPTINIPVNVGVG